MQPKKQMPFNIQVSPQQVNLISGEGALTPATEPACGCGAPSGCWCCWLRGPSTVVCLPAMHFITGPGEATLHWRRWDSSSQGQACEACKQDYKPRGAITPAKKSSGREALPLDVACVSYHEEQELHRRCKAAPRIERQRSLLEYTPSLVYQQPLRHDPPTLRSRAEWSSSVGGGGASHEAPML